ncbi:MAG: flagellar motor protein MotB [Alphaproteobacteria bacterium]|nr:flagellar motor protein MotB [Alphaproteobacteria bacterium]
MADPQKPVIIIRRKKRGGHGGGGHHGGSWKVAYADFVTAMMSFFLLMWLLNVTTSDQRKGLADYFAPASIAKSEGGAGGVMGGRTINAEGVQISDSSPPTVDNRTIPTVGQGDEGEEDVRGKSDKTGNGGKDQTAGQGEAPLTEEQALAEAMKREEEHFKDAESLLKKAIEGSPELRDLAQQLIIDRTPEGLRIQIVDRDKFSMFPSGGAIPYERGRDLLRLVGKVIARLPNKISVTGHTDSTPFPAGSRRDNWTLSSERANVSLGEIVAGGVNDQRIARVVGMSDRDPLVPDNAKDPRNRRISIVLLRQSLPPAEPQKTAESPPPAP